MHQPFKNTGPDRRISEAGLPVPQGDIRILHRAPRFVVVEKPSWLLSVPGRGPARQDSVARRIAEMLPEATGPLIVHRLDMETSGLMVVALDAAAQRHLSMQFERRQVDKAYIALLAEHDAKAAASCGVAADVLASGHGTIDLPMRLDVEDRPRQVVDHERGRPARTHWQVLSHEIDRIRIRFAPETGRTHQLRIHAAHGLGRPIIGDRLYGGQPSARLMLHASYLSFIDPGSNRRVDFHSPAPF
jgi:tRNA pseudouridine32 synthase / 23S rRNA pseudouridine746 synthase